MFLISCGESSASPHKLWCLIIGENIVGNNHCTDSPLSLSSEAGRHLTGRAAGVEGVVVLHNCTQCQCEGQSGYPAGRGERSEVIYREILSKIVSVYVYGPLVVAMLMLG